MVLDMERYLHSNFNNANISKLSAVEKEKRYMKQKILMKINIEIFWLYCAAKLNISISLTERKCVSHNA